MSVYFANQGAIDLDVIRVMGVSVKGSDSPIGYFGTGLKFAIATLLRTGHEIELTRNGKRIHFSAEPTKIRGEDFTVVHMGNERLPFTTQLGRDWEVWQAYRELHSNTLDEGGTITDTPCDGDTVFKITGDAIQREFQDRGRIFLQHEPIHKADGLEVHAGRTKFVYYRGVRAGALPDYSLYTYNFTCPMKLTEDRVLASQFDVEYKLETRIPEIADTAFHLTLLEKGSHFDQSLNFGYCGNPSKEFLDAAEQLSTDATSNYSAREMIKNLRQADNGYPACPLSDAELALISSAVNFLRPLDCDLEASEVVATETLGPGIYGLYHKGQDQIYVARQSLDNGLHFVAATLYEEWCHKRHHLKDETRELQQFLFDRLMAMTAKVPK